MLGTNCWLLMCKVVSGGGDQDSSVDMTERTIIPTNRSLNRHALHLMLHIDCTGPAMTQRHSSRGARDSTMEEDHRRRSTVHVRSVMVTTHDSMPQVAGPE